MTVASIRALAAKMDEGSALAALGGGWLATLRAEKLSRVALIFVPFWTFEVAIETTSFRDRYRVSFDALDGSLDPYRTKSDQQLSLEMSDALNRPAPLLTEEALQERVTDFARREVYLKGFGRIRDLKISVKRVSDADFHVPYWLGFWGAGDGAVHLKVMNANSGKREGKKAVELFHHWLARK
jgi:hypothetical protein